MASGTGHLMTDELCNPHSGEIASWSDKESDLSGRAHQVRPHLSV